MGVVYLAEGPLGRVAVKLVRAELADDPEFRVRFQREVQACFRVSGAYTARLVDFELDADRPWLATEFVDAPDLAARIHAGGPLDAGDQMTLAIGLAVALESIHAAGLVHRDLKPSNVMWTANGPKVIDFGVAAATGARPLTVVGGLVGTPGWLSPEQATTGGEVGAASDVFAWGSLLCYAATGSPPFGTGSLEVVLHRVQAAEPDVDESRLAPDLHALVRRALARAPQDRPSARDLCEALAQHTGVAHTLASRLSSATVAGTRILPPGEATPAGSTPVGDATPPGPTRVARVARVGPLRRRPVLYAAVAGALLAVAGTLAGLLYATGSPPAGDAHESTAPEENATAEAADFTADGPWRLVIRDTIEGEDNGCTVTVTNIETGEQRVVEDSYGTRSIQVQATGGFRWEANDPGCRVAGRAGAGKAVLPFAQQAGQGDTDAFEAPGAGVAVEVVDFGGNTECNFVLRDAADGRELDFGSVPADAGEPLVLDPSGRSQVYLEDVYCGVRVGPANG
jgi:hypothetical protein